MNVSKVNWIIENLVKEESFLELSKEAKKQGFNVQDIRGDFYKADISKYNNSCVIFNGSIEMVKLCREVLEPLGNCPISYSTFENYLCSKYYSHFSEYIFNDNYVIVPLVELKRRLYQFYGWFGKESLMFVRPDSGDKSFKAGLIDLQDFFGFYDQFEDNKHDLVVVSTPKNIVGEWRFVCTKYKEILAVSSYRYQGLITRIPSAPHKATKFCETVLDVGYYPDSVFCVDVCQDGDDNFWLMELTSFSSAGLYATNKEPIVRRVSEIALDDFTETKIASNELLTR